MREILFRGKRVDNGEWVEGYYSPVNIPITGNMGHFINVGGYRAVEIDPETVGQFIGLTDKNGVKIFVGDIVHVEVCSCSFTGCVIYWSEEARYACKTKSGTRYAICARFEFKVIGNIYDNPAAGGEQ